jgi:uncharacterized protein
MHLPPLLASPDAITPVELRRTLAHPMVTLHDILRLRGEIIALAARYGAGEVRLFGSVARGDATETSDVDFLVRFEPGRSLLDQGGLLMELRELLGGGVAVDVISEGALHGRFGQRVRSEAVAL